jgi:hypothetical protein
MLTQTVQSKFLSQVSLYMTPLFLHLVTHLNRPMVDVLPTYSYSRIDMETVHDPKVVVSARQPHEDIVPEI